MDAVIYRGGLNTFFFPKILVILNLHITYNSLSLCNRFEEEEIAADGIIIDMAYCQERDEFAYSSSDKLVYIRNFSENGSKMKLRAVLQGHEAEVSQVYSFSMLLVKWVFWV